MSRTTLAPDQLRALRDKHGYPDDVIRAVFDRVATDHTNPVSAVDRALTKAKETDRDPASAALGSSPEK